MELNKINGHTVGITQVRAVRPKGKSGACCTLVTQNTPECAKVLR